ncbi:MAG TPA: glycosyltransferase family 4 protein [Nitrososphaera sp.]|nr:glycosyltransferase family 4 protein [Nitrososphaera sp.]
MATRKDRIYYGRSETPRVLVFGYPAKGPQVGGLLWSKRVSDSISKLGVVDIRNISSERSISAKLNTRQIVRNIVPCLIRDFYDAARGLLTLPHIALLDSWGEASIILWGLLRVFQPHTRIVIVFHHYEPRILPDRISEIESHFTRAVAKRYNSIIEKLTQNMIRNSDMILTVSRTSAKQLSSLYGITGSDIKKEEEGGGGGYNLPLGPGKIRIVGTGVDRLTINTDAQKDIDFFCIGRIEKLDGIDKIWSALRKLRPEVNFVMIGRASLTEINHLKSKGIDHKGEVTDKEKLELYSRAKVFLFPSSREGFGIALAESLQLGMAAVIWRLPVFEELYSESMMAKQGWIRLVERRNYALFASEALRALDSYDRRNRIISSQPSLSSSSLSTTTSTTTSSSSSRVSSESKKTAATISILKLTEEKQQHRSEILQSWEDVALKVVKALSELI